MSASPNYQFHKHPRFSVNHLADYLSTTDAGQREGVIRKAKFPRKLTVVTYQQIMPALRKFISGNSGDLRVLDDLIARLEVKARREEGYSRDEALRCISAVEAFKAAYLQAKLGNSTLIRGRWMLCSK